MNECMTVSPDTHYFIESVLLLAYFADKETDTQRLRKKVTLRDTARTGAQDCLTSKVLTFTHDLSHPYRPCRAQGHVWEREESGDGR